MNFIGTGRRLKQGDVGNAARVIGVETAVLLAVLEVEAAGRGFDRKNRLKMLFEPHIFYRQLGKSTKRNRAVREGLAYRKWGAKKYPRSYDARYEQLNRAMKIDAEAALKSCSWALPQIMGFNHQAAGFSFPALMVKSMQQGEYEQVLAMVTLLKSWGLDKKLKGKDFTLSANWIGFASRYNGSGFRKNKYHINLAKAYRKHSKGAAMQLPGPANSHILQEGTKGEAVLNLQANLVALGYRPGPIDGRFGDKTHRAVIAFQLAWQITADGKVGAETYQKIEAALKELKNEDEKADEQIPDASTQPMFNKLAVVFLEFIRAILSIRKVE